MVQDQGIDVYLAPFDDRNKRYQQYAVPANSPAFTGDPNEVYIEAVDGERFMVVVDLMEDFDTMGSTSVMIETTLDESKTESKYTYKDLGKNLEGQTLSTKLKGRKICDFDTTKVNGEWFMCGLTFSPLQIDEDLKMDAEEVSSARMRHGVTELTITRGKDEKQVAFRPREGREKWNGYVSPDTEISSKSVVSDNRVSHALKRVILGKAEQPSVAPAYASNKNRIWKKMPGHAGNPIRFKIRYRSRDALQKLGIVPKDKTYIDLTRSSESPRVIKHEIEEGEEVRVKQEINGEENELNEPQSIRPSQGDTAHIALTPSSESPSRTRQKGKELKTKRESSEKSHGLPGTSFERTFVDLEGLPESDDSGLEHALDETPQRGIAGEASRMSTEKVDGQQSEQRRRKRKAIEAEMKMIELEQKRLRLAEELAELDDMDK